MDAPRATPTLAGRAFRVTLLGPAPDSFSGIYVDVDGENGVVHLFASDGTTHVFTVPIALAVIEWTDSRLLRP